MKKTKSGSKAKSEEFQNFERLAKALIAVPKKEVDEKKAEYDRKKLKKQAA